MIKNTLSIIQLCKKELSKSEKLKLEVLKEAQEKIDKLKQNQKMYGNLSKKMFHKPYYPGWINNYSISNSVFCYFIMKDLINEDIINPLNKNKDWFSILKNKLEFYKEFYDNEYYHSDSGEKPISEGHIENGGYIYDAFLNTHKDCIKYLMIPFLEFIIDEITKKGCFHARANIEP